jgi:sugar lactone lactonase YvrE
MKMMPTMLKPAAALMTAVLFVTPGRAQSNLPPVITNQPVSQSLVSGQAGFFRVGVTGPGPFAYQWRLNGTNLPNGIITTVAGNGTNGCSGDGGPATNASLSRPYGVAADARGSVFITDFDNNRIRKVDASGIITTVAGNGSASHSGDGGAATNASVYWPYGVVVDAGGNLLFADAGCIRQVDTNGIISTVAGGLVFPAELALDAGGNLFIADPNGLRLRKLDTNGSITSVAVRGGAISPTGVAVDADDHLSFTDGDFILKADANGVLTTVAGQGPAGYSGDGGAAAHASLDYPTGLAVDAGGNLFIADLMNACIREVNTAGIITTVAGRGRTCPGDGGAATNAALIMPHQVAVDACGDLFIADEGSYTVRKVILQGSVLPLAGVTPVNAGNYQVIVSSLWGSVTSSIATLTVSPPQISAMPNAHGSVTLNLLTAPNLSSEVLAVTNLAPPVAWQALGSNVPGTNGFWQFTDTNAGQYPVRFYRASTP